MKNYFNNKKLITLLVSFMFFLGILWYSFSHFGTPPAFQQAVNDVVAVAGRALSKPVNALNSLFVDINNLQDTFEENKQLKAKLDELTAMQTELATVNNENQRLQEELDLQATLTDYNILSGAVIARNPDRWIDQLIIDRGSQDGLENGMSVLSHNGLVGRVVEVSPTSSKVTLLTTNDEAAVLTSAEIVLEKETIFGVVNGYDPDKKVLIMEQITSTTTIEEGATVVTSGLGGLVPRGLLIGTVSEVSLDRHGLGQRVYIEPASNFEDIRFVTIIHREVETVGDAKNTTEMDEESE